MSRPSGFVVQHLNDGFHPFIRRFTGIYFNQLDKAVDAELFATRITVFCKPVAKDIEFATRKINFLTTNVLVSQDAKGRGVGGKGLISTILTTHQRRFMTCVGELHLTMTG